MVGIIKILDERITYYTGGEIGKSISEIVCDNRIVDELQYIKKRMKINNNNYEKNNNNL